MRHLFLGLAAATSLLSATLVSPAAQAEPTPQLIFGVDRAVDAPTLDRVQFFYGGRNFCWYDSAWRGPGFYWCGYAWHRGFGWGGGQGWRGWRGGGGYYGGSGNRVVIQGGGHHWSGNHWSGHHGGGHHGGGHHSGGHHGGHHHGGHRHGGKHR